MTVDFPLSAPVAVALAPLPGDAKSLTLSTLFLRVTLFPVELYLLAHWFMKSGTALCLNSDDATERGDQALAGSTSSYSIGTAVDMYLSQYWDELPLIGKVVSVDAIADQVTVHWYVRTYNGMWKPCRRRDGRNYVDWEEAIPIAAVLYVLLIGVHVQQCLLNFPKPWLTQVTPHTDMHSYSWLRTRWSRCCCIRTVAAIVLQEVSNFLSLPYLKCIGNSCNSILDD